MNYLSHRVVSRRPLPISALFRTNTAAAAAVNDAVDNVGGFGYTAEDLRTAKPFESIPGPKSYPLIGSLLCIKPVGHIDFMDKLAGGQVIKEHYGPISRYHFPFLPTPDVVELLDPNDFELVYRNEGRIPFRPPIFAILNYRKARGQCKGIVVENGEEWLKLRKPLNHIMMKPNAITPYFDTHALVADELVRNIETELKRNGSDKYPMIIADFCRWALESVGAIVFDKRLGLLNKSNKNNSAMEKLVNSALGVFETLYPISVNPKYKIYDYFGYKCKDQVYFDECMDYITDTSLSLIKEVQRDWENIPETEMQKKFLAQLIANGDLALDEKMALIFDMMTAAVDTTAYTITHNLFLLAKNPAVQEKLFAEIDKHVGRDGKLTPAKVSKMLYLRACIKETNRLKPLFPHSPRILDKDIVIKGYLIRKGTVLLCEHSYASSCPDYVDDAHQFKPERWLRKETEDGEKLPPFLILPFGFGARMCIGRRFAEQELHCGLTKLIQNFRFEYTGENLPLKGPFLDYLPLELDFKIHKR